MDLSNFFICLSGAVILSIFSYRLIKTRNTADKVNKFYFLIVLGTIALFINDCLWCFYKLLPQGITFAFILASIFFVLVSFQTIISSIFAINFFVNKLKRAKIYILVIDIIFIIVFLNVIANFFLHHMFYFDDAGKCVLKVGAYIVMSPLFLNFGNIWLYSIIETIREKNSILKRKYCGIVFFTTFILIYSTLQVFYVDSILESIAFCIGCIFLYIMNISKAYDDGVIFQKNLQQSIIGECINILYNQNSTDIAIDKILSLIAEYHNADRAYIYEINTSKFTFSNTYEWNKKGIPSRKADSQNCDLAMLDYWIDCFERENKFSMSFTPEQANNFFQLAFNSDFSFIHDVMAVPLRSKGEIIGFIGISNPNNYKDDFVVMNSVSSVIYNEILRRDHSSQDDELIKILASQYSSVFYANLKTKHFFPTVLDEQVKKKYGFLFDRGIDLQQAFKIFIDRDVHPDDKEKLLKYGDLEVVKEVLGHQKSFSITYRQNESGKFVYHSVKFIKINDVDEEPTAISIGFANQMDEVISNLVRSYLLEAYISIFYVDLNYNIIQAYKQSELTDMIKLTDEHCYSDVIQVYSKKIAEKDRNVWEKLIDPKEAQKFLMEDDTREIIYEMASKENPIRRAVWRVIERENGVPINLIVAFSTLDKKTVSNIEMTNQIAKQKDDLEKQAVLLENALKDAQKASAIKTEFLSNMSHDIRTPMNAIIGFTDLALQNIDNKDKVKDYISKSNISSKHLLSLINDILDMNKIENGKFTLNESYYNISEIIEDVRTIIHGMVQKKNQKVTVKTEIDNNYVLCDKLRVTQVIINLLSNAIKYTPENGKIDVSLKQLSNKNGEGDFVFKVIDNGVGMAPEFINKIFLPFEREKTKNNFGTTGTGLGMTITKQIIDMMNGKIDVKSKQGKGSEFTISVKLKVSEELVNKTEEPAVISKERFEEKRILVVEDNEMNREIAEELLLENGFKVECVTNGQEAVNAVSKSKTGYYDFIIMDVQMPVMNGYEAAKEIRKLKNKTNASIPIFATTANAFEEDKRLAIEAGMNEHIAKPVSITELLKIINNYL